MERGPRQNLPQPGEEWVDPNQPELTLEKRQQMAEWIRSGEPVYYPEGYLRYEDGPDDFRDRFKRYPDWNDPTIQEAGKEAVLKNIGSGYSYSLLKIFEIIAEKQPALLNDEEIKKRAIEGFVRTMRSESGARIAKEIIETFKLPDDVITIPEAREAAKERILECFEVRKTHGIAHLNTACDIEDLFKFGTNDQDIRERVKEELTYEWRTLASSAGYGPKVKEIQSTLHLITEHFTLSEEEIKQAQRGAVLNLINGNYDTWRTPHQLEELIKETGLTNSWNYYASDLQPVWQGVGTAWEIKSINDFIQFTAENRIYVQHIFKTPEQPALLTPADLEHVGTLHINLIEAEELKRGQINLQEVSEKKDFETLFNGLKKSSEAWQDTRNISGPFENGAKAFGYQ